MLSFLPSFILAPLTIGLFILNTVFWCIPLYVVVFFKIIVPVKGWRSWCSKALFRIAETWSSCNTLGLRLTQPIKLDASGVEGLSRNNFYLLTCNHQSWVDIVVLQMLLNRRIPFPRFFLKKQLIWVPLLGGAWWALDYPFMKRHSKSYLEKHPEKRSKDLETTRKSLSRIGNSPITIMNFIEGTRFREEKHQTQKSPYKNLLKPKAGGMAYAVQTLGSKLAHLLDVTIVYPEGRASFMDLFSGRIRDVIVRIRKIQIPGSFFEGSYLEDPDIRERFQAWVREIWQEKDELIEEILREYSSGTQVVDSALS